MNEPGRDARASMEKQSRSRFQDDFPEAQLYAKRAVPSPSVEVGEESGTTVGGKFSSMGLI